jgi:hypothetical protein
VSNLPSASDSSSSEEPGRSATGGRRSISLRESLQSKGKGEGSSRLGGPPIVNSGGGPGGGIALRGVRGADGVTTSPGPFSSAGGKAAIEDPRLQQCSSILCQHHDRGVVDMVLSDVVQRNLGVSFNDIAALATAKRLLNEAIVLPLMMPEFFTGIREPWKVKEGDGRGERS